jgi:aryl-alcohol dehydrogenase-like predicted oxidoreductase
VIGLGTWQFGSSEWRYGDEYAEGEALAITRRALDLGINLVDTAEIYAMGRSERIVGRALEGRRDEAFVATKVFPVLPVSAVVQQRAVASADRLGVQHIDLYQVHWPNPLVPVASTMKGMARLQRTGLVRHVGVSNFSADRWAQAEGALGGPVLTNQVQYSLMLRNPEADVIPRARAEGRIVIAYSPLAQGVLSGRYDGTNTPAGVRAKNSLFLPGNIERARPLLDTLQLVARAHGATPAQVALAWAVRGPNVVAIPGASSVAQLEANAAAADIQLTEEEDYRLGSASEQFAPTTGLRAVPHLLRDRRRRR